MKKRPISKGICSISSIDSAFLLDSLRLPRALTQTEREDKVAELIQKHLKVPGGKPELLEFNYISGMESHGLSYCFKVRIMVNNIIFIGRLVTPLGL